MQYDKSGNITRLRRRKEEGSWIDDLAYSYQPGTNRLGSLSDAVGPTPEEWDAEEASFGYDASGNLTSQSGEISNITYDHRNLPVHMALAGGGDFYAFYNGDGQRVLKETGGGSWQFYVTDGPQTLAVVDNSGFSHFNLSGNGTFGRYEPGGARRYYITDHLGSTRAVVDNSGNVLETFDYYPFGLLMPKRNTASANTIEKFTGKERGNEGGLNLDYFGARFYDPAISRWLTVDPLVDHRISWSPYNYTLNNPVNFVDKLGLCPEDGSAGDAGDGDGYCLEEIVVTATRIDETGQGKSPFSNTIAALPALGATTQLDSPVLPFADIAAGAALLGFAAYDAYLIFNPTSTEPIFTNAEKSRSLDDPESLEGATKEEVEELIPDGWVESPARTGRGTRYANPAAKGEQVRVMDGNPRSLSDLGNRSEGMSV